MSMYDACGYCGDSVVGPGTVSCSNPEHRELAKRAAQVSFNSKPTKENAVLLAKEAGLPEDYFLKQMKEEKPLGGNKKKIIGITEADFFSGIFAVFSLKGYKILLFNKAFEEAMAKTFQEFTEYANQEGVELRFRIRLHPFHNDSETIHSGLLGAVQRRIISFDSPGNEIIRIKLTKDEASAILNTVTEGRLFVGFADRIIEIFLH